MCVCYVALVRSNSLQPRGLWPTRLLCPWDSPGKNTGVGCYVLLQGIFPTQGSNSASPELANGFFTTSFTSEACCCCSGAQSRPTLCDTLTRSSLTPFRLAEIGRRLPLSAPQCKVEMVLLSINIQFSSVQSLSRVRLFVTP